jgi:hypothetical protein
MGMQGRAWIAAEDVAELWERMKADDASRLRPRTQKLYLGYWNNHLEPPSARRR